jgi:hypothetical protein
MQRDLLADAARSVNEKHAAASDSATTHWWESIPDGKGGAMPLFFEPQYLKDALENETPGTVF